MRIYTEVYILEKIKTIKLTFYLMLNIAKTLYNL